MQSVKVCLFTADTGLSLSMAELKEMPMRLEEEESNISAILLSSGGQMGQTMEISLGT